MRHVREIFANINVLVSPGQFALSKAHEAFDDSGNLSDDRQNGILNSCMKQFVDIASRQTKT